MSLQQRNLRRMHEDGAQTIPAAEDAEKVKAAGVRAAKKPMRKA